GARANNAGSKHLLNHLSHNLFVTLRISVWPYVDRRRMRFQMDVVILDAMRG
ncbi:hypothetical protein A2U01_0115957, partial [Trifolium medium]|nr:hypothetical protein [Trifolium medium]